MYRPRLYPGYIPRYSHIIIPQRIRLTVREARWRVAWPYIITLILASFMLIFTLIIFILEIASLAIDDSNKLSNTASTGAGIWCSIVFITAIIFMFLLVLVYDSSHICSVYTLVVNSIAFAFIFILISLDANAVTPYNTMISTAPTKIQVLKGQLAVAIIMLVFPLLFLAIYIYTAFMSLFPLRAHTNSVHLPIPIPSRYAKY